MRKAPIAVRTAGACVVVDEPNFVGDVNLHGRRRTAPTRIRGIRKGVSAGEAQWRIVGKTSIRINGYVTSATASAIRTRFRFSGSCHSGVVAGVRIKVV